MSEPRPGPDCQGLSPREWKLTLPVAELLPPFGSGVVLVTVAVSFTVPKALVVKTTFVVCTAPAARVPRLQANVVAVVGPIGVAGAQAAPLTAVTVNLY
ncbi:MAG TPA: hypothetical protein VIE66_03185 [Methylocella sp.]